MIFDLHTHSTASDGRLSPLQLTQHAQQAGVDVLAITDHDTIAGNSELDGLDTGKLKLIAGIELSARWRSIEIHVLGLNFQRQSPDFQDALAKQSRARLIRAEMIAEKLRKKGFPNLLPAVQQSAGTATIGRPHFADQLVNIGAVKSTDEAFRKYLGTGKVGDIKNMWSPLEDVVGWICQANGTASLAHPDKYRLTRSKLRALVEDFKSAGGHALEVISGQQQDHSTRELASLCCNYDLSASLGSDFHQLNQPWSSPGKHSTLPDNCQPVWDLW